MPDFPYLLVFSFIALVALFAVANALTKNSNGSFFDVFDQPSRLKDYRYSRKRWILTRAEADFFAALNKVTAEKYLVFPQVHLPTLLEHTSFKQNWKGALGYIIRNSVDFVLCDKATLMPVLAIELDDKSHERADRRERDIKVEHVLKQAGMPLLRVPVLNDYDLEHLKKRIDELSLKS